MNIHFDTVDLIRGIFLQEAKKSPFSADIKINGFKFTQHESWTNTFVVYSKSRNFGVEGNKTFRVTIRIDFANDNLLSIDSCWE